MSQPANQMPVVGAALQHQQQKLTASTIVLTTEGPWIPPVEKLADALERKRLEVWGNHKRNQLVAEISEAFFQGAIERLWDCSLLLDAAEFPYAQPGPGWIAVLVESAEHGRAMRELLPDWQLTNCNDDRPLATDIGGRLSDRWRQIVTLTAASERFDPFAPNVLVNAMGGRWIFDLRKFHPPGSGPQFVIDILDDFDDIAEKDSKSRLREYHAKKGWEVVTTAKWAPQHLWGESSDHA